MKYGAPEETVEVIYVILTVNVRQANRRSKNSNKFSQFGALQDDGSHNNHMVTVFLEYITLLAIYQW